MAQSQYQWKLTTGGVFELAANWDPTTGTPPGQYPTAGTQAVFLQGAGQITGPGTIDQLIVLQAASLDFAGQITTHQAQFAVSTTISGTLTQSGADQGGASGVFATGGTLTVTGTLNATTLQGQTTASGTGALTLIGATLGLSGLGAPLPVALVADGGLTVSATKISADAGGIIVGASQSGAAHDRSGTVGASTVRALFTTIGAQTGATDTLTVTGGSWTDLATTQTAGLTVGAGGTTAGGTGTLALSGGATWTDAGFDILGYGTAGAHGTVTLDNAAWSVGSALEVGESGTGAVTLANGATLGVTGQTLMAINAGSTGSLTVTGTGTLPATATVTLGAQWVVGEAGTGTATLSRAAKLVGQGVILGFASGASGALTFDASTGSFANTIQVGATGLGTMTLRNGASVTASATLASQAAFLDVGVGAPTGGGAASVSDVSVQAATLDLGANIAVVGDGGSGRFDLGAGGTFHAGGATSLVLGNGATGVGMFAQTGAKSVATFDGTVQVGAKGQGTFGVSAGGVATAATLAEAIVAGSTGAVTADGGTLSVSGVIQLGIAAAGASGGTATLTARNAGRITAGSTLSLGAGSMVTVDATSVLEVGGGTSGAAGALTIDAGAVAGGAGTIAAALANAGALVVAAGATLTLSGVVSGPGIIQVGAGGTLRLAAPGTASVTVQFLGDGDTLRADGPVSLGGTLTNFTGTDALDFTGYAVASVTAGVSGGRLVVSSGGATVANFALNGTSATAARVIDDGSGHAQVVACFAQGTRLAVPGGSRPVEALAAGDAVRLSGGGVAPVVWVGRRRVDCVRHRDPLAVWPVEVAAHAFGYGMPGRAVRLSPDHAVFWGGALIPVKHLVDGRAVRRVPVATVTYWHVELARHDVVLAEGLACESYLDVGGRADFDGGAVTTLHPAFVARAREGAFAPLTVAGPLVEALRARLLTGAPAARAAG